MSNVLQYLVIMVNISLPAICLTVIYAILELLLLLKANRIVENVLLELNKINMGKIGASLVKL